jgi:hypothetical protein
MGLVKRAATGRVTPFTRLDCTGNTRPSRLLKNAKLGDNFVIPAKAGTQNNGQNYGGITVTWRN